MDLLKEAWERLQSARRNGHLPHAVAFTGGENALEMAWRFAQSLVCERENGPCGQCGPCLRVSKRQSESVLVIESEKGMIKLDAAHSMAEFLSLQRVTRVRIVLVADAQNLNPQATNAILKLVEEPPPETYLLFVTREMSQLLPTLRSRLQVVRLPNEGDETNENPWRVPVGAFVGGCLRREFDCIKEFTEQVDSRENALAATLEMQRLFRNWCQGEALNLPEVEPQWKVQFWRWAHQIEQDLHSNVDRGLLMTHFYQRVAHALD